MTSVALFIQNHYKEYLDDESFLQPLSKRNEKLWNKCKKLLQQEKEKGGVLDIETSTFSGINNFNPGYIDKENELIVGLQTDTPLKRIVNPYGGIRLAEKCLKTYNYEMQNNLINNFKEFRKSHNDGVFDVYPKDVRAARHNGLITGLPDSYGRGRLIGDYRKVALFGINALIKEKQNYFDELDQEDMSDKIIQKREEIAMQIKALKQIELLAHSYGKDISQPATTAQEALQAIYFAYLAAVKENNGAATSLGRISTFIDIYIEQDLQKGILTEYTAQELIDQFIIKLRFIRHLRTPKYDELFGGDPTWITESIGGMSANGKSLITKTSYRFLHSLINLGSAPEPNLTILWSKNLPINFKKYCAKISILTNSIQYENDDLMTKYTLSNDYGVACCVSAMTIGEEAQFFGARCNLAKALLYAINSGQDEITQEKIVPEVNKLPDGILNYEQVWHEYKYVLQFTAHLYVQANNIIHYMHDKYAYEASQFALHDNYIKYLMAFGIAGLSVVVDSLSAIKYAKVTPIRNEKGIAVDFKVEGVFPKFGNDDDRVDQIAREVIEFFLGELKSYKLYKNATATLSVLTITSNVVYGKKTGATPDGRKAGEPFAPGANPMHNREENGALASLNSVAKIPYCLCRDGISNTFSIVPSSLGITEKDKINNLVSILDGYFIKGGHHLNVNVLSREILEQAYNNPELFPNLTIRVSGYAVLFNKLSKEQQKEVILRTFHQEL